MFQPILRREERNLRRAPGRSGNSAVFGVVGVCVYIVSGVGGQKRRKRSIRNSGREQGNKVAGMKGI